MLLRQTTNLEDGDNRRIGYTPVHKASFGVGLWKDKRMETSLLSTHSLSFFVWNLKSTKERKWRGKVEGKKLEESKE